MTDDTPHIAHSLLGNDAELFISFFLRNKLVAEQATSNDQRDDTCNFGSCSFVKEWYDKVDQRTDGATPATELKAKMCPTCCGMFSSATALLPKLTLDTKDKMGDVIRQIYLLGEDYTIYRTSRGVNVNFADCRLRERQQRTYYAQIAEKLCRLRFLSSQMARGIFNRNGGFYDHQLAEAIHLAMLRKTRKASEILDEGISLAEDRLTNENRIRYLLACLVVCLVFLGALWYGRSCTSLLSETWMPYLVAGAAGAAGAVFSIAMRIQYLILKPCAQSVMNYFMGALRVLSGFIAGAIILVIITGTVLGEGIAKLFETTSTLMAALSPASWKCILLAGFLGGFAERLVPSLLGTLQSRSDGHAAERSATSTAGEGEPGRSTS